MIQISNVRAAIFDLDDTLLDNGPADKPELWLHARSRLAAVYEAAERENLPVLATLTPAENGRAFMTARVHSIQGAIWNIFRMKGLVAGEDIDTAHPLYPLLESIAQRKHELHEVILREYGVEVPGAVNFLRALAAQGLADKIALATSAIPRDINIFLDKYEPHDLFPRQRIMSADEVSRPKPDPECFELAFRSLGLPDTPETRRSVLAFEDNPRGLLSAKGAGLYVCAITTRYTRDDPELLITEPDVVADSFAEYSSLLGMEHSRAD